MKFCLGEIVPTKADFLTLLDESENDYDLVEIWCDFITEFDLAFLENVRNRLGDKLIVLLRRNDEQGNKLSLELRKEIVDFCVRHNVLLDLDYALQAEEVKYILKSQQSPNLLLSYHDYRSTPQIDDLSVILADMQQVNARYYKLVCVCQDREAAARLMHLYVNSEQQHSSIIFGAGEHGVVTRLAALYWKQPIIYAPRDKSKFVVSGQLTLDQYEQIADVLNLKN